MAGPLGWNIVLAAFVAGMASFFSPCVAPLVPGYVGYLSGTSALRADAPDVKRRLPDPATLRASLLFVGGFSTAFVAMGLLAASFGSLLIAYRPVLQTLAGIAMLIMGAFLLNLLPTAWIQFLMREWRLAAPRGGAVGGVAPFGLGVLFAAGWTPCIGPVLGSILLYVSASANASAGAMLLALYALGFALPFLAIGLGWSVGLRALGWFKRHSHMVTVVSGIALIVVGLIYLTGQVTVISIWAQHVAPGLG